MVFGKKILILTSNGFYGSSFMLEKLFLTNNQFIIKVADWKSNKLKAIRKNGIIVSFQKFLWLNSQPKIEQLVSKYPNVSISSGDSYPKADILISLGWYKKIPKEVYSKYKLACNFHPSFLPLYRGYNPIVRAWKEKGKGGVSVHVLSDEFDKGPIISQKEINFIGKTLKQCYDECAFAGANLLLQIIQE